MVKIPEDVIEKVRTQVNIVDVVSQYVQLNQSGKNLFGLCPFHEERTPSFSVSEDKQIFHCFSCGRGGNVFKFLMELQNLSFPEAVKKVADDANIPLDDQYFSDSEFHKQQDPLQAQIIDLHEQAVTLYNHILVNTKLGQSALDYLKNRGLTSETIEKYHIGFAPKTRLLKPFVEERKVEQKILLKSGLFAETQDGELIDRFVDRIMFPIRDENGKTVGFSGRLLGSDSDGPKYLNSPETDVFNKRKVLFNLDSARKEIRTKQPALLFEGFMDVISADQAGIHAGVASMGTSLTDQQVYDIKKITKDVIICYDGDVPGQKAISRAIDVFKKETAMQIKIVAIPDGLDPDEFVNQRGADAFSELLNHAEAPIDFQLQSLKHNYNLDSSDGQADYITQALKLIAQVTSDISRSLYLNKIAKDFSVDKRVLDKQLLSLVPSRQPLTNDARKSISTPQIVNTQSTKLTTTQKAEAKLLNRMLNYHDIWLRVANTAGFSFVDDKYQMLYLLAEGYFTNHNDYNVATFSNFITESSLQSLLIEIDVSAESTEPTNEEIDDYLNIIMNQAPIDQELVKKRSQLSEATTIGDIDKQRQLTIEIIKLEQQKRLKQQA